MRSNFQTEKPPRRSSRQLLIVILAPAIIFLLPFITHPGDELANFLNRYQTWPAGELIITIIILLLASCIYTIRKMEAYKQFAANQKQVLEVIQERQELFFLAAQASRDVIYEWDQVTNKVRVSDQLFISFAYDKRIDGITIEWWMSRVHPDDVEQVKNSSYEHIRQHSNTWTCRYRFRKADGSYAHVYDRACITYNEDGSLARWIGSIIDITEMESMQTELRQAKEKAEESARSKSEFLANTSHEIRTPLNGIIGMVDLLADTELTPEQKRFLNTMDSCCETLLGLINDILDFSKIDAGKLELSPVAFSLRDEIAKELQPLSMKAVEKGLTFIFNVDSNVPDKYTGDILRIQQVFNNLAGNAIKFTHHGEIVIQVQLRSLTDKHALLLFSVSDTGIGIPADRLLPIFEEFTQADGSMTRKYGGTGLGLAITKRLVELMGGSIWVESKEGTGSIFYFTISLERQNEASRQKGKQLPASSYGKDKLRILVVEDNLVNQEIISAMLAKHGHKITLANNGREAVAYVQKEAFDIVLMDIQMPGMNGYEAARQIREQERQSGNRIYIIGLTANAMRGDREKCLEAGMDDYLSKPVRQRELMAAIEKWQQPAIHIPCKTIAAIYDSPKVNLQRLFDDFNEDCPRTRKILALFKEDAFRLLKEIEIAVKTRRVACIRPHLHTLKGQCGLVDMYAVYDIVLELEQLVFTKQFTKIEQVLPRLSQELTEALNEIGAAWTGNK